MKVGGVVAIIVAVIIGGYIYLVRAETRDVKAFCAELPQGTPAEQIFESADRYSGQLMGGRHLLGGDKPQTFIYCSPMTMCDVSCSVEVQGGVVTKSEFVSL